MLFFSKDIWFELQYIYRYKYIGLLFSRVNQSIIDLMRVDNIIFLIADNHKNQCKVDITVIDSKGEKYIYLIDWWATLDKFQITLNITIRFKSARVLPRI